MKMKNYSQLVIASIIMSAAPYFFTNATQLEPGTAPIRTFEQRTIPSLVDLSARFVAQYIINHKKSFKVDVANNTLRIGDKKIPSDLWLLIVTQYYFLSGRYFEKVFSELKSTIPSYGFSIQELLDNGRLPQPITIPWSINLSLKRIDNLDGLMNIPNFAQVVRLFLNGNQLTDISPLATANLPQLQWLFLNGNQLTDISPLATAHLPKLQWLNLSSDQLTDISPLATAHLPQLQDLDLNDNQLTDISPLVTAHLPQLRSIYLDKNPINIDTIPPYEKALSLAFKKTISSYRDNNDDTLLHKAARAGNNGAFYKLKSYGLFMDTPNKTGKTPRQLLSDALGALSPQS